MDGDLYYFDRASQYPLQLWGGKKMVWLYRSVPIYYDYFYGLIWVTPSNLAISKDYHDALGLR